MGHHARQGPVSHWETAMQKTMGAADGITGRQLSFCLGSQGPPGPFTTQSHLQPAESEGGSDCYGILPQDCHLSVPDFQSNIFRFFQVFVSWHLFLLPSSYTSDYSFHASCSIPCLLNLLPLIFPPGVLTLLFCLVILLFTAMVAATAGLVATSLASCLHTLQVINKESK